MNDGNNEEANTLTNDTDLNSSGGNDEEPTPVEGAVRKNRKRFHCLVSRCTKTYSTKSNVRAHIKASHKRILYICEIDECEQLFTAESSYARHLKNCHESDFEAQRHLAQVKEHQILKKRGKTIEMSEDAMMAKIVRLHREIQNLDKIISELEEKVNKQS